MKELKCPGEMDLSGNSLFLGGGISSCPQWQWAMVDLLGETDLVLVNPRRNDFDATDPTMTRKQIEWEHKYLARVTARMFWFPSETLCPITLFELGKFIGGPDPLFVGCHPDYQRKADLQIQLELARPQDCEISYSLIELAGRIARWSEKP